jgi:septum formation protein
MNMEIKPHLILASASPRRKELLATLGLPFDIVVPEIDEIPFANENPRAFAERMAQEKAGAVHREGIIIAADTIVVHRGVILGKPTDKVHARIMLKALSADQHEVITGVCVRSENRIDVFSCSTQVIFRAVEDSEIDAYIETGDPMDKAGAYAIQGGAAHMVQAITGSYTNVVGLPLCELHESLISF